MKGNIRITFYFLSRSPTSTMEIILVHRFGYITALRMDYGEKLNDDPNRYAAIFSHAQVENYSCHKEFPFYGII